MWRMVIVAVVVLLCVSCAGRVEVHARGRVDDDCVSGRFDGIVAVDVRAAGEGRERPTGSDRAAIAVIAAVLVLSTARSKSSKTLVPAVSVAVRRMS